MMIGIGEVKRVAIKSVSLLGLPLTFLAAVWLHWVRKGGISNVEDRIFMKVGMIPIIDQYYQPLVNPKRDLFKSLRLDRTLPGIDLAPKNQLDMLDKFDFNKELLRFPIEKSASHEYYYNCDTFRAGDAEYLYSIIRYLKPKNIIEIGSGMSTLMTRNALDKNKEEDHDYFCRHICVEPYEQPWLEERGIEVIRERVETLDKSIFEKLNYNDILFIDSSHIIRTQGDVLFEYLELLPILKPGVFVHIHDIFTPKDYLTEWVLTHNLWNEQYLLEAFLSFNEKYKVVGALNYLAHNFYEEFSKKNPIFASQPKGEPGSFWIVRS